MEERERESRLTFVRVVDHTLDDVVDEHGFKVLVNVEYG